MKKLTKDDVINKFMNIHINKYDYSLVDYKNMRTKIKIICPIHGVFEQLPSTHLNGCGCNKCAIILKSNNLKLSKKDYIKRSNIIHKYKYDYSLMEYIDSYTKIKIICPIHGIFEQNANSHLLGTGCPSCKKVKKLTNDEFINRSNHIHCNLYDYSLTDYKNIQTKVKIICPIHGIFKKSPAKHLNGSGCNKCKQTKGEKQVRLFLENNNINYELEKKFKNCKNILPLSFDFYLPLHNTCIEYDGIQHFKPIKIFGGETELEKTKLRDQIKTEYCKNNNIKLIRIKYNEEIDKILLKKLKM